MTKKTDFIGKILISPKGSKWQITNIEPFKMLTIKGYELFIKNIETNKQTVYPFFLSEAMFLLRGFKAGNGWQMFSNN